MGGRNRAEGQVASKMRGMREQFVAKPGDIVAVKNPRIKRLPWESGRVSERITTWVENHFGDTSVTTDYKVRLNLTGRMVKVGPESIRVGPASDILRLAAELNTREKE